MQAAEKQPWYKQFWPWFLIFLPVCSMVLSFNMLRLAMNTEDSLVQDDYYNEGRAINLSIEKVELAKQLGIQTQILVTEKDITLTVLQGQFADGSALTLDFFHATQDFKDFNIVLLKDAKGLYRASLDKPLEGKWHVSLHPHDNQWKIQQVISLPQQTPIVFNP
jgi:uncharacterized protein